MREQRPSITGAYRLSCTCGEDIIVQARGAGRSVSCPRCKATHEFIVAVDPRTRKPRVALVLPPADLAPPPSAPLKPETRKTRVRAPRVEPPPPPPPPPPSRRRADVATAPCACGAPIEVEEDELAADRTCAACGTAYHAVVKMERGTGKKSLILVPKDPLGAHKPKSGASLPPPRITMRSTRKATRMLSGAPIRPAEPLPPLQHARSRSLWGAAPPPPQPPGLEAPAEPPPPPPRAKPPIVRRPAPPAETPVGTQRVACPCGEPFFIRRKELGSEKICPGCSKRLVFEEVRDPQTLAPRVRARIVSD